MVAQGVGGIIAAVWYLMCTTYDIIYSMLLSMYVYIYIYIYIYIYNYSIYYIRHNQRDSMYELQFGIYIYMFYEGLLPA